VATAWVNVRSFPTRYEAFERTGAWCLHAEVRRHPTALQGREYVAEVCRDGHGESLLARDFPEAVRLASEWLGLS
jgi:hypothetical protein